MRTGIFFCYLVFSSLIALSLSAQQETPYILNGNAYQESCNCYQLTDAINWQAGSVWNKNKIDLTNSFNYIFNVYLGCKDNTGADGIVFVLQPIGTSIGIAGQGLGFQNVIPSIGIPIDTYQNIEFNDPPYDHIGIYKNGDLVNGTVNTLAGPVQAVSGNDNIEDCQWHTLRVIWDAGTTTISAEVDGVPRVQATLDLVHEVFGGDPMVFWGFSAATGGSNNLQKFCTSLNPGISTPADLKTCAPALVPLTDSSTSFGSITNWWWDFGDGTRSTSQQPDPHAYPTPGNYTVKLNIEANNGCISDTFYKKIIVGSIPDAAFTTSPPVICANSPAQFTDMSRVEYGTINQWEWNFNNGAATLQLTEPGLVKTFPAGSMQIELITQTVEGCISAPFTKSMNITPKPSTSIAGQDACYGDPVQFTAANLSPAVPIHQWYWTTGDGGQDSGATVKYNYAAGGQYTVGVYAVNDAGCSSDTATLAITIYQTNARVGNDTIVAFGQPLQLTATGGEYYQWLPADGLDNPEIADPVAILYGDMQYIVKAYTSFGCPTYDTIRIKAYKNPGIYIPNAFTPNNDGHNDRFHPVAAGIRSMDYFEVFNRLGQRVFRSQDAGQGWDGTLDGKPQPMGTYVWIIRGLDYLGKMHSEKGTVELIR
jgi:gliding motility-associated-like protein